jgi:hypothetical protein
MVCGLPVRTGFLRILLVLRARFLSALHSLAVHSALHEMTTFASSMDALHSKVQARQQQIFESVYLPKAYAMGEKGALAHSAAGVGDARLALFSKLVRGMTEEAVLTAVHAIVQQAEDAATCAEKVQILQDAFVMAFHTRDVRGGKGERDLAYSMLLTLYGAEPEAALQCLALLPEYGSWKDLVVIADDIEHHALGKECIRLMAAQLQADAKSASPRSLCAKWAPREKSRYSKVAKALRRSMFPDTSSRPITSYADVAKHPEQRSAPVDAHAAHKYRALVSRLTAKLDVAEVHMTTGTWAEIDPTSIPAVCLKNNKHALLNRILPNKKKRTRGAVDEDGDDSRVRFPLNEDRIACAARMQEVLEKSKTDKSVSLHGAVLHPHQLTAHYMNSCSHGEDEIVEAQWRDLRNKCMGQAGTLGKLVPLIDVSGSMEGEPMQVAIALGILLTEVTAPALRDRFITFESNPKWQALDPNASLRQKVAVAKAAPWGGSTNFAKAIRLILQAAVNSELPAAEMEGVTLVVFSDMEFDVAGREYSSRIAQHNWATEHEKLVAEFAHHGYSAPHIVYWNLRANTSDYAVQHDTPGVSMVSGFSQNLLKLFMEGKVDALTDPMITMREALDNARYDKVRAVCSSAALGSC